MHNLFCLKSFFLFLFLTSTLATSSIAKDTGSNCSHFDKTAGQWTDSDWINWWTNIENLYLGGMSEEGLYWLLKHDLSVLGQSEDILADINFPDPDPDWGGGSPIRPNPPSIQKSSSRGSFVRTSNGCLKYADMPNQWADMIEEHGLDPNSFGGMYIPPPPLWVAVSIQTLGGTLTATRHPHATAAGVAFIVVGGVLIIWIDEAEEDDE